MSISNFQTIQTDRLQLRPLSQNDAKEIFLLRSDQEHNKYLDRPIATSIEDATVFIDKIQQLTNAGNSYFWAISVEPEKSLAGTIGLWNFDESKSKAEMGYELLSAYQRKGIVTEAIKAVLDLCFKTLQLKKIEAWTHPENVKSYTILEKLGFKRDHEAEKEKPEDAIEIIFSLTAQNYL